MKLSFASLTLLWTAVGIVDQSRGVYGLVVVVKTLAAQAKIIGTNIVKIRQSWQVQIGGLSKAELQQWIRQQNIGMNEYAAILFNDEKFTTSDDVQTLQAVHICLYDLGLTEGALYSDIVLTAEQAGLKLCPLELAPYLRMHYSGQPQDPYLTVASAKTRNDESYPNGFYLRHYDDRLWLRGYRSTSDWLWSSDSHFVFLLA